MRLLRQIIFDEAGVHWLLCEGHVAKGRVSIVVERCKACGFCVEFCPTKVLALSSAFNSKGYHPPHVVNPEKCSGCDLCGMYCPDFAIHGHKVAGAKEVGHEG
jgi:2-oxoglutarate ferredoxin oxidoreductase subunit delta